MNTYLIAGLLIGAATGYALGLLAIVVLSYETSLRRRTPARAGGPSPRTNGHLEARPGGNQTRSVALDPLEPVAPVLDGSFLPSPRSADRALASPARNASGAVRSGLITVTVTGPSIGIQSLDVPRSFAQLTVGSGPDADLQVNEASVAGSHLILQRSAENWSVCRSAGAPPAALGGRSIGTTPELLRSAEVVQFGEASLTIDTEGH